MSGPCRGGMVVGSLVALFFTTIAGATSSGRIAGVVLTTDDTPQPVRRAMVTLVPRFNTWRMVREYAEKYYTSK